MYQTYRLSHVEHTCVLVLVTEIHAEKTGHCEVYVCGSSAIRIKK